MYKRQGYALGHVDAIAGMERVRESFNVNGPCLAAAVAWLADASHLRESVDATRRERDALRDALARRGWKVWPSQTNFLLVEFGAETADVERRLLAQGVVLRPMGGYGLPQCLRITVGTSIENAPLLAALDAITGPAGG